MSTRPAALPMYDFNRPAVQAWWHGLAAALRDEGLQHVPDHLAWPSALQAHWQTAQLLFSQTCGHPLRTTLWGRVQVVGAFHYAVPGCVGMRYRSELVARSGEGSGIADFRGRTAAFNDRQSHSGWHALHQLVLPMASAASPHTAFFASCIETGSHRASLAAVQEGHADLAAIDCVTFAGLKRYHPRLLDGLVPIGHTASSPGLPLITGTATTADELLRLRRALQAACADPALASVRQDLFIAGFEAAAADVWVHGGSLQGR